jgi:hypothetical protein
LQFFFNSKLLLLIDNSNYNPLEDFTMAQLPPEALGMDSYIEVISVSSQNAFSLPPEALGLNPFDGVTPINGVSDYDIVKKAIQLRTAVENLN